MYHGCTICEQGEKMEEETFNEYICLLNIMAARFMFTQDADSLAMMQLC